MSPLTALTVCCTGVELPKSGLGIRGFNLSVNNDRKGIIKSLIEYTRVLDGCIKRDGIVSCI